MVLIHYNGKLSASNANAYSAIVHQVAGFRQADEGLTEGRQAATPEYIVEKTPTSFLLSIAMKPLVRGKSTENCWKMTNRFARPMRFVKEKLSIFSRTFGISPAAGLRA